MKKVTKSLIKVSGVIMASLAVSELTQPVLASSNSSLRTEHSAKKTSSSSTIPCAMDLEWNKKTATEVDNTTLHYEADNTTLYYITTKDKVRYYGYLKNNELVIVPFGITKHDGHKCIAAYYRGKTYYRRINSKKESIDISISVGNSTYLAPSLDSNYQVKEIDQKYARNQIQKAETEQQDQDKKEAAKEQSQEENRVEKNTKKQPLYQYLSQHQDQKVQKITIVKGNPNETESLYLVGSQTQITQAVNDLNNYHPDNSITILPNKSGIKIFNDCWEIVNDPDQLYESGEKVSIDPHVSNATDMQNQIKQDEFSTLILHR